MIFFSLQYISEPLFNMLPGIVNLKELPKYEAFIKFLWSQSFFLFLIMKHLEVLEKYIFLEMWD